jgi:hypothetical protein
MFIKTLTRTAVIVAAVCMASTASYAAAITIQTGNNPLTGSENVLFNDGTLISSGTTVQGILPSDTMVNFTSTSSLTTPSGGQARVAGNNYTNLNIALDGNSFDGIVLNLNVANADGGAPETGTVSFTVTPTSGSTFMQNFSVSSAGQNFFTIFSDTTVDIASIALQLTGVGLLDVRQVRIAEAEMGPPNPNPVPAPASLALLGLGLFGLGAATRRRA